MARKKISEFRAKALLSQALDLPYKGIALDEQTDWSDELKRLSHDQTYVVKVDQGVKGRFKKGLVLLERPAAGVAQDARGLMAQGFRHMLVEEYQPHAATQEAYISIERRREGNMCLYSVRGGVDVEQQLETMQQAQLPDEAAKIEAGLGLPKGMMTKLNEVFEANYLAFLEINPLVVDGDNVNILDAAIEVDEEAASLVAGRWTVTDFRNYATRPRLPEELAVEDLAAQSRASFRLEVLNPDGQVFLLLSGGGASVMLADEVANQGYGQQLGNYGEYSGNPSEEETYLYTRQILLLLLGSKAGRKVLVIGGGVANFTDVRATFQGVIRALKDVQDHLRQQNIKVFVRRGGPFEVEGLAMMKTFLEQAGILGRVAGPELMLAEIIPLALQTLTEEAAV